MDENTQILSRELELHRRIALLEMARVGLVEKCDCATEDARRYRWLRDGNAYKPEEAGISGGAELDDLCDDALAAARKKERDG